VASALDIWSVGVRCVHITPNIMKNSRVSNYGTAGGTGEGH
jgi:hypothetical protein